MTSGRAARKRRASATPRRSRAGDDPDGEHAPSAIRAQHDVAEIAREGALVVRGDLAPGEQRAHGGGDGLERRLGDATAVEESTTSCERGAKAPSTTRAPRAATTSLLRFR